jgi:hypothetical protein
MTTIEYNGQGSDTIDSVKRYCERRYMGFKTGGEGKITILYDGAKVCECNSLSQLDDVLALSQNRILPTMKEACYYLVRGGLTFIGFFTLEKIVEKISGHKVRL